MNTNSQNSHCACGDTSFQVSGKPLLRVFCHCTICQEYNQGPYADITMFRNNDVSLPKENSVTFKAHAFPPVVQRGICNSCGKPAIEYLKIFPLPTVFIVPSKNISDKTYIPEASFHMFYDKRVEDIQDDLPKYSGYLKSQLAYCHNLMISMLKNK